MGTVVLRVQAPNNSTRMNFTGPVSNIPYTWSAIDNGETVEVDEADVPGLLELTFKRGKDCGCSGGVHVAQGNNETVNYFSRTTS